MSKTYKSHTVVGEFNHINVLELDSESGMNHRRVVSPGDSEVGESTAVKSEMSQSHTTSVKNAYAAHIASA